MTARIQPWLPTARSRYLSAKQRKPLAAGWPGSHKEDSSWAISS